MSTQERIDPIYFGNTPGMKRWGTDFDTVAEWAGGPENVTIGFTHSPVLDLSRDPEVIENQYCCMGQTYKCGHYSYGPPRMLPSTCPECSTE